MKKKSIDYIDKYLNAAIKLVRQVDKKEIEATIRVLVNLKKKKGRLFLLGVGGSAANCSHAVNDFRKICHIETYAPTDNVSELTARTNDDGFDTIFSNWLHVSKLHKNDVVMIFSVGGGNLEKNISTNIIRALEFAIKVGSPILGIISRDGGHTRKVAHVSIHLPIDEAELITPLAESFQALIWHLIVTHPKLRQK